MKNLLKKTGAFLLVAILMLSMLTPLTAMAAISGQCGDNLTWTLDDSGTLTISGTGAMWNWGFREAPWYSHCSSIKRAVINYGVTSIGNCALYQCTNLASVSIPGSVTGIGEYAFWDCYGLTTMSIPSSVTTIDARAFGKCFSLTSISLSEGIIRIGRDAFYECNSLASINIPSSLIYIGGGALTCCENLTSIRVDANNPAYCDIDGVVFSKDKTVIHAYPEGKKETSYMIPEGVSTIGYDAFTGSNLVSISLPSSVTTIGYRAFCWCYDLTTINIPESVTYIGYLAFYVCESLTTINIPESVTYIDESAFSHCSSLTTINIPRSVTYIGKGVFDSCDSLADIYYGGSEAQWKTLAKDAEIPETTKIHYNSVQPGTIIGSALRTNITSVINGRAIPSFNVDGYTYIVAEDLKDYGFSVYYDNSTRTLSLTRDNSKTTVSRYYIKPYVPESEVGIKEHDILATDIVTYLDNNYVESYNINGQTIIRFDTLNRYAGVSYDNATRIIWVTIPGIN